ncbi:DUF2442 domain-containing protein [Spirulina subsalsa FACHB-351]|uniref:DUF2442 domain-containing protein n=1 Tax=Spirulina subsalsa FACHB-351 TaxID=234711 RepID=A0ABT3LAH4_9CYAN|nr:DUF2442 domain-containing protein [Spirulina subsalsa]MCW6038493.1 DUF2442 domain-containing protein [Spirulina subsalsa FACHB-351]
MKPPRIISAQAIDDRTLLINFSNQDIRKYDISKLLENPLFSLLKTPQFFKNFKIEAGGYALVWTEDIDISEYELWKNGDPLTQEEMNHDLEWSSNI